MTEEIPQGRFRIGGLPAGLVIYCMIIASMIIDIFFGTSVYQISQLSHHRYFHIRISDPEGKAGCRH